MKPVRAPDERGGWGGWGGGGVGRDGGGGWSGRVRKAAEWWALAGGAALVAVVALTAVSAAGNILLDKPVPGDFEVVEIAVAVAAFAFLPYCQLTGANVSADIFTSRLGPRALAALSLMSSALAAAFAALLLWRMSLGMLDYRADGEITHILGFPVWLAFPPMLFSLALLLLSGIASVSGALPELFKKEAARE